MSSKHCASSPKKLNNSDNGSLNLFTSSILAGNTNLWVLAAKVLFLNYSLRFSKDALSDAGLALPDVDMFFDKNAATALFHISKPKHDDLGMVAAG